MQDLGVFHSLGALWLRALNEPEAKGQKPFIPTMQAKAQRSGSCCIPQRCRMPRCPTPIIEKQSCRRLCGHHHEPLTDEGYIPCVSLLDFQKTGGKLDMTAYCRALDFGCKAYVNLVMLHLIQKEIVEKTGIPCGKLILIVKSARFYLRDREKVLAIIDKVH